MLVSSCSINHLLEKKKASYFFCILIYFKARQTYKETTEDIYELISNYSQLYGLQMKLQFSASGNFYINMAAAQLTKNGGTLPDEFINVIKKRKTLQFTTMELVNST
jgi:DNA mismatch repair protein MSH4